MNLTWSGEAYELALASPREHHLVRDSVVEAAYIVDGLPDTESIARLGRAKEQIHRFAGEWIEFRPARTLSVPDLEFVRLCFLETLDFFSEAEYRLRTGWERQDAERVLAALLEDRKRITISRQWG